MGEKIFRTWEFPQSGSKAEDRREQAQICADLVAKVADICLLVLKEGVHLLEYLKNHLNAQFTH